MLADAVASLTSYNPGLVRDIYRAAFGYSETSDAPTPMRRGVLSLTSNRRQDYQMGLWQLVQSYPEFLRAAPQEAVVAMNAALESYVTQEHSSSAEEAAPFDLDGKRALILADYSHIWDRGQGHRGEYAVELLDHLERRLEDLADGNGDPAKRTNLLDTVVRTCRVACVWRRLLGLGTRYPNQIGMRIRAAGWSLPILMCRETIRDVGTMNGTLFLDLPEADREKIERAILSIPEEAPAERRSWAEWTRNRLLGCLPESGLVTSEAQEHLSALRAVDEIPRNDDGVSIQVGSRKFGEAEYLAHEGVPVEDAPNKRLRELLEAPIKEFANGHANKPPESQELAEALPYLRQLYTALRSSKADGVHEKQADHAWGSLAEACCAIAKMGDLRCDEEAGAFVRTVLLEASRNRVPTIDSDDADERFVDPIWGKPAARIDAAEGLMAILQHPSCENPDVLAAVERLSVDSAPSVRYQIAIWLLVRYVRDPDWTWSMIERMARDRSPGVLRGLVEGPLNRLKFRDPARVAGITIGIRETAADVPEREKLVNSCADVLVYLFVWGRDTAASDIIDGLADDPLAHLREVTHLVRRFREFLVSSETDPPDPDADAAGGRSWSFLLRVTRGVAAEFLRGAEREGDTHNVAEDGPTKEQMENLANLLNWVGSNIYFASGAHHDDESLGKQVLRRFHIESGEVIDELAKVGLPQLSHHLLRTLEVLVPADPRRVFLRVARVIGGGRRGGYQYDRMAEEVVVRIVDRYLADHRELFQRDEEVQRHLIGILDTFVHAGSESARRLSYGLDGIFR